MGRMVRKQINMTAELDEALETRATELGISQSEVVRLAVERFIEESDFDRREQAWRDLQGHWKSGDELGVGSSGSDWSREELHERPGDSRRHERSGLRSRHQRD